MLAEPKPDGSTMRRDANAIKAYRPSSNSLSSGQVLHCPYKADKAKLVIREMMDLLVLDLVDKGLVTDQQ